MQQFPHDADCIFYFILLPLPAVLFWTTKVLDSCCMQAANAIAGWPGGSWHSGFLNASCELHTLLHRSIALGCPWQVSFATSLSRCSLRRRSWKYPRGSATMLYHSHSCHLMFFLHQCESAESVFSCHRVTVIIFQAVPSTLHKAFGLVAERSERDRRYRRERDERGRGTHSNSLAGCLLVASDQDLRRLTSNILQHQNDIAQMRIYNYNIILI